MKTRFYLEIVNGVETLFFQLIKKALGDAGAPDTDITLKAEKAHVAAYSRAYQEFKEAHPSYVLQWPELDYIVPVAEEVIEEVAKELPAVEPVVEPVAEEVTEEAKPV